MNLTSYLMTVGAISVLTTISQILMPSGKLKKTVSVVFKIILIISIIRPIAEINIDYTDVFEKNELTVDYRAVSAITEKRIDNLEKTCTMRLSDQGIDNAKVEIKARENNSQIIVEEVSVILDETSISDENEHIIISQQAVQLLSDLLSVDKEAIIVR